MAKDKATHFVIYYFERLQDGYDEWSKIVGSKQEALQIINDMIGRVHCPEHHNARYKLFELGKEIPLQQEIIEEPQPSKKKVRFSL